MSEEIIFAENGQSAMMKLGDLLEAVLTVGWFNSVDSLSTVGSDVMLRSLVSIALQ